MDSAYAASRPPKSTRPRVGVDAHVLDGKPQGTATFMARTLRELAGLDLPFDVSVYSAEPDKAAALTGPSSFAFHRLPAAGSAERLFRLFPHAFARDRIDLGIFQYVAPPLGRVRSLIVAHDILPRSHPSLFPLKFRLPWSVMLKRSIHRSKAIVTASEYSRGEILRYYRPPADHVFVMPQGPSFDVESYFKAPPAPASRARPYVLTVGRIERRKNIDLLIRAFRRAGLPEVDLVIVGRTDHDFELQPFADSNVVRLERVENAELFTLYRHAALSVFPSRAEGFGLPLLDSLLSGLPTIASNQTAMQEVGAGRAEMFDPTREDAEAVLADLIRGHFQERPIAPAGESERRALVARYNWTAGARVLADAAVHALS